MDSRLEPLLESVRQLEPLIREHAAASENECRLAGAVVESFKEAGLYRLYRPRAWGGLELHPVTAVTVFEEAARIDGSAGWNLMNNSSIDVFGALFPEEGAKEMFGTPDDVVAAAAQPPGRAVPAEGGYRVTAQTAFMSGCSEATWCISGAFIMDGEKPRMAPTGNPLVLLAGYPREEARIVSHWDTLGMRGTGSHDVSVHELFVPEHRTALMAPRKPTVEAYQGTLYRMSIWGTLLPSLASVSLGVARAAIDVVNELAKSKVPAYVTTGLKDRGVVHTNIAKAEARYRAARAFLHEALHEAWDKTETKGKLTTEDKINVQLACTFANTASAEAVDLVYELSGGTGMRAEFPLQRHFRDIHTLTQHAFVGAPRFESCGRLMLGVESDWGFFAL